jgi:hypothetical protein
MFVIGLPGQSVGTEAWMRSLFGSLGIADPPARVQHYRHWDDHDVPDIDWEATRVRSETPELVLAKSLGTLITIRAYAEYGFRPLRAVLMGTPIRHYTDHQVEVLCDFVDHIPTLVIQQTADSKGPYAMLAGVLPELARSAMCEIPGENHYYAPDVVRPLFEGWYGGQIAARHPEGSADEDWLF